MAEDAAFLPMKQALFAVLALMLISFLAFNFQRRKLASEMNVIRTEFLMMATGVATEHLDALSTLRLRLGDGSGDVRIGQQPASYLFSPARAVPRSYGGLLAV